VAIKREQASCDGLGKNIEFYGILVTKMDEKNVTARVDQIWSEPRARVEIEKVYGEFRKSAAA
jgi:hypothetical protein